MSRINLDDNINDILFKLSNGNYGAVSVLIDALKDEGDYGTQFVLMLDEYEIYGSSIWRLYKDVCGEDLAVTMNMVKAVQFGKLPLAELKKGIEDGRNHTLTLLTESPKPEWSKL